MGTDFSASHCANCSAVGFILEPACEPCKRSTLDWPGGASEVSGRYSFAENSSLSSLIASSHSSTPFSADGSLAGVRTDDWKRATHVPLCHRRRGLTNIYLLAQCSIIFTSDPYLSIFLLKTIAAVFSARV
ncbi:conserved hypothetical protein [Saccharomyces cerevisiae RM11-1a]|uniref:EC1118_1J19_0650p n=3 Tax=Saccharomyces cerevisiae TaxID=4932 RepID=C8ZBR3_YEAS8|nr:conserved protein [Saccharomyces cerevisiae YJM789]EDV12851.1 conserved hypothetical protein [Saccharomyces cerevisiae RM11-1a]KZV10379.1 hypothetical protein WN66_03695 [Saccharomyces cerevisiae]CAY80829.1 EC1118_1J19_0650p [Saccharomyces cerevisiae EC1118]